MDTIANITKISQVTPEVTLFLRELGFTNYYIIKIFDMVGDAAIGITEDNPYWVLEEFHRFGFEKADKIAGKLGICGDDSRRIQAAVEYGLRIYAGEGHTFAPLDEFCGKLVSMLDVSSTLVTDVIEDMAYDGRVQLSVVDDQRVVYFYSFYKAECALAGKLAAISEPSCSLKPVGANIDALIRKAIDASGIELSEHQIKAIKNSLIFGVSIITGGPGTGKTTIINTLVSIMEGNGHKVAIAAPTGRAAKRIMETSGHFACTIHRLLEYAFDEESGYMRFGRNSAQPLEVDTVIIDEASMMDLMLAEALCDAVKPGTRLILVGDADQLPSVSAGNVLDDLIESDYFNVSELKEIYRQSDDSTIVANAHRINRGEYPLFADDFLLIKASKQQDILDRIAKIASEYNADDVQILTPTKKGIVGSINLNKTLQELYNPHDDSKAEMIFGSKVLRVGDRVMQLKNNYRLEFSCGEKKGKGVFNGETGTIKAVDSEMKTITVLYDDERWVEYPYPNIDEIDLAYAVTVHKSQGSEFPVIIMPMTWFPPVLATRSLIYTAITRGKNKVVIVGNEAYLNAMVDNDTGRKRNSGLRTRIETLYAFRG